MPTTWTTAGSTEIRQGIWCTEPDEAVNAAFRADGGMEQGGGPRPPAPDGVATVTSRSRRCAPEPSGLDGAKARLPGRPLGRPVEARAPIPMDDDLPPPRAGDDLNSDTDDAFEDDPTSFTDSFGRPDVPTDPDRIAALRSDQFDHAKGRARASRSTAVTPSGWPRSRANDATLRFLEALNFDADECAEPGVEVVDTAIEKAVVFDDEPEASTPPPTLVADTAENELADVASARATQWTGRATKP